MASIRMAQRHIRRCVGTRLSLGFDEADSVSSAPGIQTTKLCQGNLKRSETGSTMCSSSASLPVVEEEAALHYSDSSATQEPTPVERQTADKAVGPERSQFWQEMFSALSMLFPSIYAYLVYEAALDQVAAFRPGVYALVYSCWAHCGCSMAYHFSMAWHIGLPGFEPMTSPLRVLDLSAIHFCCVTFGWAVSQGSALFTAVLFLLNYSWVRRLVDMNVKGLPGSQGDGLRIGLGIMLYTSPMLLRGDTGNYFGAIFFWLASGACWAFNHRFNGWLHGVFHLLLTPYFHFLLRSAAGVAGDASFLV